MVIISIRRVQYLEFTAIWFGKKWHLIRASKTSTQNDNIHSLTLGYRPIQTKARKFFQSRKREGESGECSSVRAAGSGQPSSTPPLPVRISPPVALQDDVLECSGVGRPTTLGRNFLWKLTVLCKIELASFSLFLVFSSKQSKNLMWKM